MTRLLPALCLLAATAAAAEPAARELFRPSDVPPFTTAARGDPERAARLAAVLRDHPFTQYGGELPMVASEREVVNALLDPVVAAVHVAPGDPHRRYELACVLMAAGRADDAAAQLEPLARADCPECRNALARYALGRDWTCGWKDTPRLVALRGKVRTTAVFEAALQLVGAFTAARADKVDRLIDAKAEVSITTHCTVCDAPDDVTRTTLAGGDAVRAWVQKQWPAPLPDGTPVNAGSLSALRCEGRCCSQVPTGMTHHSSQLVELCFTPQDPPRLGSLTIWNG